MKCSVEECGKEAKGSNGLCSGHGHRLRRYGSPNGKPDVRAKGICAVEGCGRGLAGAGYCVPHYKRFRKFGDPLAGGIKWGEAREFVADAIKSRTDDCINFPYCRSADGYGRLRIGGKTIGAHCYVAERVHGSKPTSKHETCHSCGNGHLACINPRHLYWGTRTDNVQDAKAHGTLHRFDYKSGDAHLNTKYSDAVVIEIKRRLDRGDRQVTVSRELDVPYSVVHNVKHGRRSVSCSIASNDNTPAHEECVA